MIGKKNHYLISYDKTILTWKLEANTPPLICESQVKEKGQLHDPIILISETTSTNYRIICLEIYQWTETVQIVIKGQKEDGT